MNSRAIASARETEREREVGAEERKVYNCIYKINDAFD